jgi:molybdenum cofactor cytidylyltransferase
VYARKRGHPIVFDAALFDELCRISEETQGVRAVLERHLGDVLEVEFDDPVVRLDLNEPSDLAQTSRE